MPVSAAKGRQTGDILAEARKHLPNDGLMFPEDELTDKSERFLAAGIELNTPDVNAGRPVEFELHINCRRQDPSARAYVYLYENPLIRPLNRDRSALTLTAARMKADPVFRDAAHHFLRSFDRIFQEFEKAASDSELSDLAETRTVRAFMLLGRVTGIFD